MTDESTRNRHDSSGPAQGVDGAGERALRNLFAHVAPREAPPAAVAAEIRAAVYAEWDALTSRRVLLRRVGAVLAAAAVAGVAIVVLQRPGALGPEVAAVERIHGAIEIGGTPAAEGDAVRTNALLTTGAGEVALRLRNGASLRFAPQTRARFDDAGDAELLAGALYFDSAQSDSTGHFAVRTEVGTLHDVGTQFLATLRGNRLEVGVRDGRVTVERGDERVAATVGERLSVPRGAGPIDRQTMPTYGEAWAWADGLAPRFAIDGQRLVDFFGWVERETGRRVVYADAAAERAARETVLHGAIDLEPLPKLGAVLTLTDLGYTLDGERIIIRAR